MEQPVTAIKGVGDAAAKLLRKLGIETIGDLLYYFPRRYDDYSTIEDISEIRPGTVCIRGQIRSVRGKYVRRGMHITEAVASDKSGSVRLVWFNQPYREAALKKTETYYIVGEFGLSARRMSVVNPSIEVEKSEQLHSARIIPVYKETKGITSLQIRKYIAEALRLCKNHLIEVIPERTISPLGLISYGQALVNIHFPISKDYLIKAKQRLGFDELFIVMAAGQLNKEELKGEHALSIKFKRELARSFVKNLPFSLTDSQRKVIWQMYLDMQRDTPMNRLLEGDVGSGKTVVAAMTAVMVLANEYQVAFMAPTEILAKQHADTVHALLEPLGLADKVALLIGSSKNKPSLKKRLGRGLPMFVIGTHALISSDVIMPKLGLVVVDEQHRFGVGQRKALQSKSGGHMPHVLHMTATPIPRSLALTVYGDLDISILETVPRGRKQTLTSVVSPNSMSQLYAKVDAEIDDGKQVFWVCPIITDSTSLNYKPAESVYKQLKDGPFRRRRIGLLHGKLKSTDKDRVMDKFSEGGIDILVSTTVIEVGVDIPNATVMVIEGADRFGLAQIHQLRGRVGRGSAQSYCYLVMSDSRRPTKRLRLLEQTSDGFKLAEYDLKERGPGAIYGLMQHGQLDLKMADISDTKLISKAQAAAREFIKQKENLVQYSEIGARIQKARAVTNLN